MREPFYNVLIKDWEHLLASLQLRSVFDPLPRNEYIQLSVRSYPINENKNLLALWTSTEPYEKFQQSIKRLWQEKIHDEPVRRTLLPILEEWIINRENIKDKISTKKSLQIFIDEIEKIILDLSVIIGITGLKLPEGYSYSNDNWELLPNNDLSLLQSIMAKFLLRYDTWEEKEILVKILERSDSFVVMKFTAHSERTYKDAITKTRNLIEILRLYFGSHYLDIVDEHPRASMGIIGDVPRFDDTALLQFLGHTWSEETSPGFLFNEIYSHPLLLTIDSFTEIESKGFKELLHIFEQVRLERANSHQLRIHRAVKWFSKGTKALSKDDSYIAYAIAMESLLSSANTHSEKNFVKQIAALLANNENELYIFEKRRKNLNVPALSIRGEMSKRDFYEVIKQDIKILIQVRHDIVHGTRILTNSDLGDLKDFEILIRNIILLFLQGGWESLDAFEKWRKETYPDNESPQKSILYHLKGIDRAIEKLKGNS